MGAEKDTTLQLRVSSETLDAAKEIYESEGKSASQAVREFLEETVAQGKTPIRHALSESEQAYKTMLRKEERAIDSICGTVTPRKASDGGIQTPEEMLLTAIFGDGTASELTDKQLRYWGKSVGLPESLSLTVLSELHDCGLFPKDVCDLNEEFAIKSADDRTFGAENIRQSISLVSMRLLSNALSAYYAEIEAENN